MTIEFTIPEAAAQLALPYDQVLRCVRRLGLGRRVSRLHLVTDADLVTIRNGVHRRMGNPNWIAAKKTDV